MTSKIAVENAQEFVPANNDNPKLGTNRKLEIETGEGLFYLLFCGIQGVGKTSVITRYCQNRFPKWYDPMEVSHHSVENISRHQCLFEFVEVDGFDGLRPAVDGYTSGSTTLDGLVLVYDVGDRPTFTALPEIYQTVVALSGKPGIPVAVMANKVDIFQDSREVDVDEGKELAEAIGGFYGQCSAREADGVKDLIHQVMTAAVKIRLYSIEEKEYQESTIRGDAVEQVQTTRDVKMKRSISERIMARLSITST